MNNNFKKIFSILLALYVCSTAHAQLTIETLDSFATEIRKIEQAADGLTYNDGKNDYILGFAEESFGFSYKDGKAWKAVNKINIATTTYITEDIDLASATGMLVNFTKEKAATITMYFPDSAIRTTVYAENKEPYVLYEDKLEFFFHNNAGTATTAADLNHENLFFLLGDLVLRAQEKKGMVTRQDAVAQTEALKNIDPTGLSIATHEDFLAKYPNSIFKLDVIEMMNKRKKRWDLIVKKCTGAYGDKGQIKVNAKGYDLILSIQGHELPLSTKDYAVFRYIPQKITVIFNAMNDGRVMMELTLNGEVDYHYKLK